MAALCPLLIAWPASFYTSWQKQRLTETLAELQSAHDELAGVHKELAAAHQALAEQSRHDDMTGMLNRTAFFQMMAQARRRSDAGGTLLIIDADRFKKINDTHGHQTGDRALLAIASAIRKAARENDLVARIGGEEFAVFLAGTESEDAAVAAERIRNAVEALDFRLPGGERLPLTVSIGGIAHSPQAPFAELMREADRRLYAAKRAGRNRIDLAPALPAAA